MRTLNTGKVILVLVIPLVVVGWLYGCTSGGNGVLPPALPDGTFTRTVELSSPPVNGWGVNFDNGYTSIRVQHLYRAHYLDGSGYIDSISFRYYADETAAVSCSNVTMKMGHTSRSDLDAAFANNVEEGRGTHTEVLSHATVVIPAGTAGDYFEIPFERKFYYNGVDSLVVEIIRDGTCTDLVEIMMVTFTSLPTPTTSIVHPFDSTQSNSIQQNNLLPDAKFHFCGGSNRLEYGGSIVPNNCPFTTTAQSQKAQFLHFSSDINGSGTINGVAMRIGAQTFSVEEYVLTMRLGHTSLGSLNVNFDDNYNRDEPVVVANNLVFKVPEGLSPGQYLWIPMPDGSFSYNGTDNLIVEIDVSSATGNTSWYQYTIIAAGPYVRAWGESGSSTAASRNTMQHQTMFRFKGDRISLITQNGMSGATGETFPFSTFDGKVQYLFLAPELGTKGAITELCCRAFSNSVNDSYNYTIVMSHTTASTLTTTFADNLSDPVVVFSGVYRIPYGLLKGDWFEIPLSPPFSYNGRGNLVVEITGIGGSSNSCVLDTSSATLYNQRRLIGGSSDITGNNSSAFMIDTQFILK